MHTVHSSPHLALTLTVGCGPLYREMGDHSPICPLKLTPARAGVEAQW
jgi:hypothetical protein